MIFPFQRIFSVNADTDGYNTRTALIDYLHQFTSGIRWIRFNCARLKFFMLPTEFDDTINELTEHFNEIDSVAKRADTSLLRAQKWISSDKMIDLSHDMIELLATGFSLVEKVASILHDTNSLAVSRLAANG
jgi:hypothetical protein